MSDDDGYVHDPAAFDDEARNRSRDDDAVSRGDENPRLSDHASNGRAGDAREPSDPREKVADAADDAPRGAERTFGWRGWVLVGWLVVAFVLVPAYLFFFPRAGDALALFGLGFRDTFLVLPLIPAVVLGVLAVWATTRP